jgi:predicted acyltransferase
MLSVDALRGLTIAFMILVNDPGDWAHVYAPLDHAEWNGFTPTDLVFPTFLFLIGCAIVFSVSSRVASGVLRGTIALQIVRRAATLFVLKLFLSAYPHFHLANLRLYGVLTRIALCYLLAGLLFLYVRRARTLALVAAALLVGYWVLLRFVPIPGLGHPVRDFPMLDPERNLTAWIDRGVSGFTLRTIHMGRLYQKTRDPEGLLSTLPAVATVLFGILTGLFLRSKWVPHVSLLRRGWGRPLSLALPGVASLAAALAWNPWFAINKNLWTSSYVLFAGGWSLVLLALCYWLFDTLKVQQRSRAGRALLWPLLVYGSNAITAFVFSEFVVETLLWWKVPRAPGADGTPRTISAWGWVYQHGFARHGSTANTSLAFACAYVVFCFLPNWLLWRRKIFLRI